MPDANQAIGKLFADYREYCFRNYPTWASYEGDHRYDDRLTDLSDAAEEARYDSVQGFLDRLLQLPYDLLSMDHRLNYDLFKWMLEKNLEGRQFHPHYTPIGQQDGIHIEFPQIIEYQQLDSVAHFKKYFTRLKGFGKQVDDIIANMRKGMEAKIVQPKFIMEQVFTQIEGIRTMQTDTIPFMLPLLSKKESITESEQQQLKNELRQIIDEHVKPAYARLGDFIRNEYLPACRSEAGIWALPDGDKRYARAVAYYTTTNLTPEQIYEIGLKEVERIRDEMEKLKNKIGFKGTLKEFFYHLRTDKKQQYTRKEDLLNGYRDILSRMDKKLPELFGKLPNTPYELKEIEAYRAASAPQAYYYSAPEDFSRPGYFYVNTYDLPARPIYTMTALALHEAVPGHHLQIMLAKEKKEIPWFRKHLGVTAFVEGWGLYAEYLGYETGMYDDPYQHFGALDFEIWRACRLVADVGLHKKKWTREQAVQYLLDNSANSETDTRSEVDRYISWPGQALAYKIGEMKIKELRKKAEQSLGGKFDVRAFHDMLLENGAIPLGMLENKVDEWVKNKVMSG
ncbi:MAG TPA: DUF885 domain-containing protein [Chitinophagales bacterium]|nr:DUF885 domain-containing protein [Chitinophagales bacterium]